MLHSRGVSLEVPTGVLVSLKQYMTATNPHGAYYTSQTQASPPAQTSPWLAVFMIISQSYYIAKMLGATRLGTAIADRFQSLSRPTDEDKITIVEVGPRDGLQNIESQIPTQTKVELISRLYHAGLSSIELTSVVSPKAVPQLADCREVLTSESIQSLLADDRLRLPVLVPNSKGLHIALDRGVREVALFVSASDGFSKANINCSVDESLDRASAVASEARSLGIHLRGYVSCIFADPFDGPTDTKAVVRVVGRLLAMGCYQISLGDTLGIGTPTQVAELLCELHNSGVSPAVLAVHFHDTYGQALANVWQAYQHGIRVFDSSIGGLGGCPYCPGAKGNVATEDLVYSFAQAGVDTGIDINALTKVGEWIRKELGIPNGSRAGQALIVTERQTPICRKRPRRDSIVDAIRHTASAHDKSNLFRAEGQLSALWEICRTLWRNKHQASVPMGT